MRIEKNVSEPRGREYSDSKKNRRRQRMISPVQRLYETCKETFANCGPGVVPSAEKIERLKEVLGIHFFSSNLGLMLNCCGVIISLFYFILKCICGPKYHIWLTRYMIRHCYYNHFWNRFNPIFVFFELQKGWGLRAGNRTRLDSQPIELLN